MKTTKNSLQPVKFELKPKLSKRDKEILYDTSGHSTGVGKPYDRASAGIAMLLFLLPFWFIYNFIRFFFWGIKELFKAILRS